MCVMFIPFCVKKCPRHTSGKNWLLQKPEPLVHFIQNFTGFFSFVKISLFLSYVWYSFFTQYWCIVKTFFRKHKKLCLIYIPNCVKKDTRRTREIYWFLRKKRTPWKTIKWTDGSRFCNNQCFPLVRLAPFLHKTR